MKLGASDALLVVDVQNDFCTGGALAVSEGEAVAPVINGLMAGFEHIILTQDWHPANHFSFASSHEGKSPFETIDAVYGAQTLWPDHCVQGTDGAGFHPSLNTAPARLVVRKGFNPSIDSYSAFYENDLATPTGLTGALRELGIKRVFLAGLATDFCVAFSAIDARREGFDALVVMDGCRAIDIEGSLSAAKASMSEHGVQFCQSGEVET